MLSSSTTHIHRTLSDYQIFDIVDCLSKPINIGDICLKPNYSDLKLIVISDIYLKTYKYSYTNLYGTANNTSYYYIVIEYKQIDNIANYRISNTRISKTKKISNYIFDITNCPSEIKINTVIKLDEYQKLNYIYSSPTHLELEYISNIVKKEKAMRLEKEQEKTNDVNHCK